MIDRDEGEQDTSRNGPAPLGVVEEIEGALDHVTRYSFHDKIVAAGGKIIAATEGGAEKAGGKRDDPSDSEGSAEHEQPDSE